MASAFDLLRGSQRRARWAPVTARPDSHSAFEPAAVPSRARGLLRSGAVGADERSGLWWIVQESELQFFHASGPQWPPNSVQALPADVSLLASCVVPLTQGLSGVAGSLISALAVFSDLRISILQASGERVDLPKPQGAPFGQAPSFVVAAAPHPNGGSAGAVLVVCTTAGRLFSIFWKQSTGIAEVEAGCLWPCTLASEGLLGRVFKRLRRMNSDSSNNVDETIEPKFRFKGVQVLPSSLGGTRQLFMLLAWSDTHVALYSHPHSTEPATLVWIASIADLITGSPTIQLLSARYVTSTEGDGHSSSGNFLLVLLACDEEGTRLARLSWPPTTTYPEPAAFSTSLSLGIARSLEFDSGSCTLLASCGSSVIAALKDGPSGRYTISKVAFLDDNRMAYAGSQKVDTGVLALMALPSKGQFYAITATGPLTVGVTAEDIDDSMVPLEALMDPAFALQAAHDLYKTGREMAAVSLCSKAFSAHGAAAILKALASRTAEMLDAQAAEDAAGANRWKGVSAEATARHLLFDKARDFEQWLCFLEECGVWTCTGGEPNVSSVKQNTAEACERIAAASKLMEFHDQQPEVFTSAVHQALLQDEFFENISPAEEMLRFYSRPSRCERLLASLADYPRSLPLGSGAVSDAVIFVMNAAAAFLDAAIERRKQIWLNHPTLLPPSEPEHAKRYLALAVQPVAGLGNPWLLATSVRNGLAALRAVSLEVLPTAPVEGLPLLDAQALRVVEGFEALSRSTLRAAHATFSDLHCATMAQVRRDVLKDLAEAESKLAEEPSALGGLQRTLALAEAYEDFEFVVNILAASDLPRLDKHMTSSEGFRTRALAQCLRKPRLQPLFFRSLRMRPIPQDLLEELLLPYPELRWTMDVHGLDEFNSSEQDWLRALASVKQRACASALAEKSAAKRDVFAALAVIACAAAGKGSNLELERPIANIASLGRLQRICHRFSKRDLDDEIEQSKRVGPQGPALGIEECLVSLSGCIREALPSLREEGAEAQLIADTARLIRLVEADVAERGFEIQALLPKDPSAASSASSSGGATATAGSLQKLWTEVVLADELLWRQVLVAPEGSNRDQMIANTGFYLIVTNLMAGHSIRQMPPSSCLEALSGARPEIRPLAPALRLSELQALSQRSV